MLRFFRSATSLRRLSDSSTLSGLAALPILFVPMTADAQQAGQINQAPASPAQQQLQQEAGQQPAVGVDEVMVTAQRREERLQDVPIAISAIGGERALATGITDTTSLNGKVAGLNISVRGPQNFVFLRGVGSTTVGPNAETSVATYVDGVYIYSGIGNSFPLNAVERVEVLKGPQGTLFGRNATGGLIQIVTKDPSHDPEASISAGYGNYDTVTGSLYASTGLTDNLAINLAVNVQEQGEGWGRNITRNTDNSYFNYQTYRSKIQFTPSDKTTITATLDYAYLDNAGANNAPPNGVRGADGVVRNLKPHDSVSNFPELYKSQTYLGALKIEQDLGFADFTSISAYREVRARLIFDQDASPLPLVGATIGFPSHNYSQEIQLAGAPSEKFNWMVGGYYFDAYAAFEPLTITGLAVAPFASLATFGPQDTESFSLFGQATYEVLPKTRLTAGLRHTWETQTQEGANVRGNGTVISAIPDVETQDRDLTWRLSLDHKFTDEILGYVSYNRGLKSGGFNSASPARPPYRPEMLDAYEVGLKTTLFDNRLRLNTAAYLYKYEDLQVVFAIPGANFTSNAASATINGFEADFQAVPVENFTLYGSIAYVDSEFDEYPNSLRFPPSRLDGPGVIFNAAGKRTVFTPEWSGSLGGTYVISSEIGEFTLDALLTFSDSVFVAPDNRLTLPSYETVNATINWKPNTGPFGIRVWGRNLTDEDYRTTGISGSLGDQVISAPPRTYGITLTADF